MVRISREVVVGGMFLGLGCGALFGAVWSGSFLGLVPEALSIGVPQILSARRTLLALGTDGLDPRVNESRVPTIGLPRQAPGPSHMKDVAMRSERVRAPGPHRVQVVDVQMPTTAMAPS